MVFGSKFVRFGISGTHLFDEPQMQFGALGGFANRCHMLLNIVWISTVWII